MKSPKYWNIDLLEKYQAMLLGGESQAEQFAFLQENFGVKWEEALQELHEEEEPKPKTNKPLEIIGLLFMLAGLGAVLWSRFTNPDMTSVRWFIEYWHIWLASMLGVGVGIWIYNYSRV
ncbi:MAG: hypothetical protein J0M11_03690 [Anaerolineae bacterium]|nr:hypothetical protein [Anaerolineae bacterium]